MPTTKPPATAPDTNNLLNKLAVLQRTTLSDTTLWRRVKDGSFPAPVRVSLNRIAWREGDVYRWLAERTAVVCR